MQLVYTRCPVVEHERSIFLAGPTPRDRHTKSWRPEALSLAEKLGFDGVIYVPEHADPGVLFFEPGDSKEQSHVSQCEWEWDALHAATRIVFWVPRDLDRFPGFTTNIEMGFYVGTAADKVIYGRPETAIKVDYLDWLYKKVCNKNPLNTLFGVMSAACSFP